MFVLMYACIMYVCTHVCMYYVCLCLCMHVLCMFVLMYACLHIYKGEDASARPITKPMYIHTQTN